jgi:DNA replication protein DnaC
MAHLLEKLIALANFHAIHNALKSGPIEDLGRKQLNCDKHGVFFSSGKRLARRDVWATCTDCQQDARRAEMDEARLARENQAKRAHDVMLGRASVPLRFATRTLDNFKAETPDQLRALAISRDFCADWTATKRKGAWLVFSGLPGTGKSHLAIAILQAIMPGVVGRYMTCMELIQTIRATWRKDSEDSETELLEALTSIPLLVLDEIGVQYGTESEQHHLFDVLDRRYREMMPTILLTNQNKDGFRQFVGDRVYDRMTEVARWVPFEWTSYRTQARKDFA